MGRVIAPVANEAELAVLDRVLEDASLKHKHAVRVQVVLNRARGKRTTDIAEYLRVHPVSVSKWVRMFNEGGIERLI